MRSLLYFSTALALLNTTLAQSLVELIQVTPQCALPCILTGVQVSQCNLTQTSLSDCVCSNITLQANLSICVQKACTFQDQVLAVNVETELCKSFPKESRSSEIRNTAIILSAITFPLVILRCWSRWVISRSFWWDDGAALAATFFLIVLGTIEIVSKSISAPELIDGSAIMFFMLSIAGAQLGFGKHYWQISLSEGTLILKLYYVAQMMYILVQDFAKISILLLYHRVFPRPWFKLATKIFIGFIASHGTAFLIAIIFQCMPIYSIWDRTITGKCIDLTATGYTGAVFSIVEDLAILFLPISELKDLNLGVKKRVSLILLFSIGSFACVTSMVRLKYVVSFSNSFDSTWDNVDVVIWSMLELYSALICACLPSLRPLLVQYAPSVFKLLTSNPKSSRGSSYRMHNWKPSLGTGEEFQGLSGNAAGGHMFKDEGIRGPSVAAQVGEARMDIKSGYSHYERGVDTKSTVHTTESSFPSTDREKNLPAPPEKARQFLSRG